MVKISGKGANPNPVTEPMHSKEETNTMHGLTTFSSGLIFSTSLYSSCVSCSSSYSSVFGFFIDLVVCLELASGSVHKRRLSRLLAAGPHSDGPFRRAWQCLRQRSLSGPDPTDDMLQNHKPRQSTSQEIVLALYAYPTLPVPVYKDVLQH